MSLSQEQLEAIRTAVATAMDTRPAATTAELAVADAAAAAEMGQPAAADINAISHTIPKFFVRITINADPIRSSCVASSHSLDFLLLPPDEK